MTTDETALILLCGFVGNINFICNNKNGGHYFNLVMGPFSVLPLFLFTILLPLLLL